MRDACTARRSLLPVLAISVPLGFTSYRTLNRITNLHLDLELWEDKSVAEAASLVIMSGHITEVRRNLSVAACQPCRKAKVGCDHVHPCSRCIRRGLQHQW